MVPFPVVVVDVNAVDGVALDAITGLVIPVGIDCGGLWPLPCQTGPTLLRPQRAEPSITGINWSLTPAEPYVIGIIYTAFLSGLDVGKGLDENLHVG
jgi:hypothetical protein